MPLADALKKRKWLLDHECVERSAKVTTDTHSKYQVVAKIDDGRNFSFRWQATAVKCESASRSVASGTDKVVQCSGVNRQGKRCGLKSSSGLQCTHQPVGRCEECRSKFLAAVPLRNGATCCKWHKRHLDASSSDEN
eukprot:gnl/TRDRNA2_/TRDRNA2_58353_c0_seq1.p1 gnl/TRDRNA2_/TRDRNA2_58353_c0~~gnl/TRDRNA2_/TRDRNA2_58353_c0_seq1.p1  ORF type:complete len:137 (-),score=20.44 gnl/TRDRNA2_/TRDRNA2_58353_c0_seq1:69-479(-)